MSDDTPSVHSTMRNLLNKIEKALTLGDQKTALALGKRAQALYNDVRQDNRDRFNALEAAYTARYIGDVPEPTNVPPAAPKKRRVIRSGDRAPQPQPITAEIVPIHGDQVEENADMTTAEIESLVGEIAALRSEIAAERAEREAMKEELVDALNQFGEQLAVLEDRSVVVESTKRTSPKVIRRVGGKVTDDEAMEMLEMYESGTTYLDIAIATGRSQTTVFGAIKKAKLM